VTLLILPIFAFSSRILAQGHIRNSTQGKIPNRVNLEGLIEVL